MGNRGSSLSIDTKVMNDLVVNATMDNTTECFSKLTADQDITITEGSFEHKASAFSQICKDCITGIAKVAQARDALEFDAAKRDKHYKIQKPNPELIATLNGGGTIGGLGPCTLVCKDNVVSNVAQGATFRASSTCDVDTINRTNIDQQVKGAVQQELKNQQDVFGQLGDLISSNSESVATKLTNKMTQDITQSFVQNLHSRAAAIQSLSIQDSNSLFVNGISQMYSSTQDTSLKVVNDVTNQLRQSAEFAIAQSLSNKNDTIGDILDAGLATFENTAGMLQDTITQIIMIATVLVVAGLLGFSILYFGDSNFKSYFRKNVLKKPV